MKLSIARHARVLWIAAALACGATAAVVARDFEKVEIKSEKVADGIWMVRGAGGNIGVWAGPDGLVMIDSQFAPLSSRIARKIKELSDQPIHTLINTHWHGDHTGGNENFAKDGTQIIAHDNVRKRMSEMHVFGRSVGDTAQPSPPRALPVITFDDELELHLNGEDVKVVHVAPAHTDGDAYVWFPKANVIHAGDLLFNGFYPFIDASSGGNIDGMIAGDDRLLALVNAQTRIIPGHGPLADRAALQRFRDMLFDYRSRVAKGLAAGQTLDQLKSAHVTADLDSIWGKGGIPPADFIGMTYEQMSARHTTKK